MDASKEMLREIETAWAELYNEVLNNHKFKFENFETVFTQTYSLLKSFSTETTLDKQFVRLIAKAYLFANIDGNSLENTCRAATVLTERMLCNFAFGTLNAEETSVYFIESREEITLNFNDVDESISLLVKMYDKLYWRNLNN